MYFHFEFRLRDKRCSVCGAKSGRFDKCRNCYEFEEQQREELRLRREEEYRRRAGR
jgi:hypothetical protein